MRRRKCRPVTSYVDEIGGVIGRKSIHRLSSSSATTPAGVNSNALKLGFSESDSIDDRYREQN